MPLRSVVHHVNGNGRDNRGANLVICQDQAYHRHLHQRTRALKACGHAGWRPCVYCYRYDDPAAMRPRRGVRHGRALGYCHLECSARYQRERLARRRAATSPARVEAEMAPWTACIACEGRGATPVPPCDCNGYCDHAPDFAPCWRCKGAGVDPDSDPTTTEDTP